MNDRGKECAQKRAMAESNGAHACAEHDRPGPKGLHRESAFRVAGSVQTSMHTQTHMFGALLDGGCREA